MSRPRALFVPSSHVLAYLPRGPLHSRASAIQCCLIEPLSKHTKVPTDKSQPSRG